METIYALATAPGRSGVAVIRISGPQAHAVAGRLSGAIPPARQASLRVLRDAAGELLDQALVLRFDAPASFTGEDVVELQVHGGTAVYRAVLRALAETGVARPAEPGEFTRRALENNRLDLSQVEGLADLIDAETEAQRRQAARVFSGALTQCVEAWRQKLIRAAALLEATIDFADEDVPVDVSAEVEQLLGGIEAELNAEIEGSRVAERLRSGFEVAIVGPPNVGKSTLLNRLAGRDAAIVSEIAGTTRDVIEVRMDLGGLPVTFLDTAGLRDTEDEIESIGVSRAILRADSADVRIFLTDTLEGIAVGRKPHDIVVKPKGDLREDCDNSVSGKTGAGIDNLIGCIMQIFEQWLSEEYVATHERHREIMQAAQRFLKSARGQLAHGPDGYDIASEELRASIRRLESLVGRIDVENLLDEIFASFCLGK